MSFPVTPFVPVSSTTRSIRKSLERSLFDPEIKMAQNVTMRGLTLFFTFSSMRGLTLFFISLLVFFVFRDPGRISANHSEILPTISARGSGRAVIPTIGKEGSRLANNHQDFKKNEINYLDDVLKCRASKDSLPHYALIDSLGQITDQAANAVSLGLEERAAVQRAYDALQEKMRASISSNLVEMTNDEKDGLKVYRIPAFREEAGKNFGEFVNELTQRIGSQKAIELAKSMPVENLAGEFGKFDAMIKITPNTSIDPSRISNEKRLGLSWMTSEFRDPQSGKIVRSGGSFIQNADTQYFGFFTAMQK